MNRAVGDVLASYVNSAREILASPGASPETSQYSIFQTLLEDLSAKVGHGKGLAFIPQANAENVGVPDFRVTRNGELLGWVELKAPQKHLDHLKGHDRRQRDRFVDGLQNFILTNGWQWELYQDGRPVTSATIGSATEFDLHALNPTFTDEGLEAFRDLIDRFFSHSLASYTSATAAVSALAIRARALRNGLTVLGESEAGAMLQTLKKDFASLVFRNGQKYDWGRFVDSYVQIAAFGALLWRLEAKEDISLSHQIGLKHGVHPLLYQCLQILWSPQSRPAMLVPLLEALTQTINLIPPGLFDTHKAPTPGAVPSDPIIHAYEPFFSVYDSDTRDAAGVFYTPMQVVQHIIGGVEHFMTSAFDRPLGLLDPNARYLDPAVGTGTFLLGLAKATASAATALGLPADKAVNELLTERVAAFEIMPGAYAVAHQRIEALLETYGAPATTRLPIYLTDTLAAPEIGTLVTSGFGLAGDEILKERERADELKAQHELLVVLGNPPYERLPSKTSMDPFAKGLMKVLTDATPAEYRLDLKSASDMFVAFWLWSMWVLQPPAIRMESAQVPQIDTTKADGLIAFVSNRTWIAGRSLIGLRSLALKGAKEIWVLDLGGDNRGSDGVKDFTPSDQNVFDIQVGVAVTWVIFDRNYEGQPKVHYRRMFGSRRQKFDELALPFDPTKFQVVPSTGDDHVLIPVEWDSQEIANAPSLPSLFVDKPETGFQSARDTKQYSPLNVDKSEVLSVDLAQSGTKARWTGALGRWASLSEANRLKEWSTAQSLRTRQQPPAVDSLQADKVRRVLYRPLDYRWLYDDPSWIDWYRDDLHRVYELGDVPTLITKPRGQGAGPTAIHTLALPEQHSFKGSAGGKAIWHLWRPASDAVDKFQTPDSRSIVGGRRTGFSTAVLDWLDQIGRAGAFDDAYSFVLATLTASDYSARNWRALDVDSPRVPLTIDPSLFDRGAEIGKRVRAAWELNAPSRSDIKWLASSNAGGPLGKAAWKDGVLRFANGRELAGVTLEAWQFRVSGYRVLPKWFSAREHWHLSISQATEAMAVVSSVTAILEQAVNANELLVPYSAD